MRSGPPLPSAAAAAAALAGLALLGAGVRPAVAAIDPPAGAAVPFTGTIEVSRDKSTPAWPKQPKAAAGAPNVVVVLLDDVGFGAAGTFGGPAATPELDRLAAGGLRYNQFHTTAICSPTRAALLTGRNHHQVGFGTLQDIPAGYPGYNTIWHQETASVAKILKQAGYSTAAFGKWHNTPSWEISPAGPFDHWPTGLGFDYFYGFMFGENSQWEPRLYRGTTPVEPPKTPQQGYHLTSDLVDDALRWVHQHDSVAPDKPFFLYFATGAAHAPFHVPKEWIDRYKGKFDQGWDKLREETFERQKRLGVVPANAELTPRPEGLPAWAKLSADQKRLYARQMEVYAAFLEHTDHEVGRLLDGLKADGKADNTLVLYVVGDNGGSGEGGLEGSDTNFATLVGERSDLATQLRHIDDLGGPLYDNHYATGWAWATSAPFQWMKQIASHFGGTRNGLVVSWPGHTARPEVVRPHFSHVTDIVPTILDAAHVAPPAEIDRVAQIPLEGQSLLPTFTDPASPSRHTTQYFEILGNRAIYKDGWVAAARRYAPWELFTNPIKAFTGNPEKDRWELYNVAEDFSEARDLAAKYPEKLRELQAAFDAEARRNGVYPLIPLPLQPDTPSLVGDRRSFTYGEGVERLPLAAVPDLTGRGHRLTATISRPVAGADGVIVAEGGRWGGFTLFVKDGKVIYEVNGRGTRHQRIVSSAPLPAGESTIVFDFTPDLLTRAASLLPIKLASAGTGKLLINGKEVGSAHFDVFGGFASSVNESFDVGRDTGSPVSPDYAAPSPFGGTVTRVRLDLK